VVARIETDRYPFGVVCVPNGGPHLKNIENNLGNFFKKYSHVANGVHYYRANFQYELSYILSAAKMTKSQ
jgi:hypothetical protein